MTRTSRSPVALASGLLVGLLAVGCAASVADLTLISTKNVDLSNASVDARSGERVKG